MTEIYSRHVMTNSNIVNLTMIVNFSNLSGSVNFQWTVKFNFYVLSKNVKNILKHLIFKAFSRFCIVALLEFLLEMIVLFVGTYKNIILEAI